MVIKIKVSEIAKDFGKQNKEIIAKTGSFGANGTEIGKVKLSSKGVSEAKLTISKDALTSDLFLVLPENCELISWQIK